MSRFQWHPKTEGNYRRETGWESCVGVTAPSFVCKRCGEKRLSPGRKPVVRGTSKFGYVCAECSKPAIFTAMLTGSLAIPEVPKKHVRKVTFDEGRQAHPNAAVEISLDKARLALAAGCYTVAEVVANTGLCRTTANRRLNDLVDKGIAVADSDGVRTIGWRLKK